MAPKTPWGAFWTVGPAAHLMLHEGFEFPGFRLLDAPVFNGADGSAMYAGDMYEPFVALDLAMVFGSRLWGHEAPVAARDTAPVPAPGAGDLFSHDLRERAVEAVCRRVARELGDEPDEWRALVLHTGSEAVETALKTALRASGRPNLAAFEGAYHGTFGLALAVTHGTEFRGPWATQYAAGAVRWTPWGELPKLGDDVACVIVEPWLGRAGVVPPPPEFHAELRAACDRAGVLLVLDAVLCGSGRAGATIATCIREARPDLVCLGKAIGSGRTASVCLARRTVAEAAWSHGAVEPAHTSTSLGAPDACAGVLVALERLETRSEELRSAEAAWREQLGALGASSGLEVRGLGLVWALDTGRAGGGIELADELRRAHRILVVPSGRDGASITIYPAVSTSDAERLRLTDAVRSIVG